MNKYIIELICALIPIKNNKVKVRHFLKSLDIISDCVNISKFMKTQINPNTVLIYEANNCHGECIPSYLKKFKDEGFKIHLILPRALQESKPFCRIPDKYLPDETFNITFSTQKFVLKNSKIKEYEKIFICTTEDYYTEKSTLERFTIDDVIKSKLLLMEHDKRNIEKYNEQEFVKNNQLFMITNFENDKNIKTLVPDYFGEVNITRKNESITKFIMVGSFDQKRRNVSLLFSAVEKLLENNIKNFSVTIIGGGKAGEINEHLLSYLDFRGRLDYEQTYEAIEEADYFLPLLDPEIERNRDYLQYLTTGSKQIVNGFKKPWLINKEFADVYGFDNNNSIVYKENELYDAMVKAIQTSSKDYQIIQNNIKANFSDIDLCKTQDI